MAWNVGMLIWMLIFVHLMTQVVNLVSVDNMELWSYDKMIPWLIFRHLWNQMVDLVHNNTKNVSKWQKHIFHLRVCHELVHMAIELPRCEILRHIICHVMFSLYPSYVKNVGWEVLSAEVECQGEIFLAYDTSIWSGVGYHSLIIKMHSYRDLHFNSHRPKVASDGNRSFHG